MRPEHHMMDFVPFMALALGDQTPVITRLIEAGIIGGVVMFGTVTAIDKDIEWLKHELREVKSEMTTLRSEINRQNQAPSR